MKRKENFVKEMKDSYLLAVAGWVSVFVLAWLLVLRAIPFDLMSGGFCAFFFILAVCGTALSSEK